MHESHEALTHIMPLLCACLKRSSWPLAAVSRTFSKQRAPGLLFARNRQIRIIELPGLRRVLDGVGR